MTQSEVGFHVIPQKWKDGDGQPVQAVLDARLTLSMQNSTIHEFVRAFCEAVSMETGIPVRIGTVPINLFLQQRNTIEARNDSARDILTRVLKDLPVALVWRLLYSASLSKGYILNVVLPG